MAAADLEIRTLSLGQIRPAMYNPRKPLKPGSPAWQKLETSLKEFGLVEPLIWNETSGCLVGGHARWKILQNLGFTEIPVSVVHLDPRREKALNIMLNNQEAQGRFDTRLLAEILTELEELPELSLTGFDAQTLRLLQLEPVPDLPQEETRAGLVEVTLEIPVEQWVAVEKKLNGIVSEYDLVVHVRQRSE